MNRRFFISSSIAVGAIALWSRLPSWARTGTNADEDVRAPRGDAALKSPDSSIQDKAKSKGIQKVIKTDAEWKAQ